jgi:flagellar motor protein MotB
MKIFCFLPLFLFGMSSLSRADQTENFLGLALGARPAALGGTYQALSDDQAGIGFNPAGMANLVQSQAGFNHVQWIDGIEYDRLAAVLAEPGVWSLGLDFGYLQEDPTQWTQAQDSLAAHALAAGFSVARPFFHQLALGLRMHVEQEMWQPWPGYDQDLDYGASLDLGLQYLGLIQNLDLGLSLRNLGFGSQAIRTYRFTLPANGTLPNNITLNPGFMMPRFAGGLAYGLFDGRWKLALDLDLPALQPSSVHLGTEAWILEPLALRLGVILGPASYATAGLGWRYRNWDFDYAFMTADSLGPTHRLSASLRWGSPLARTFSVHEAIAPNGDGPYRNITFEHQMRAQARMKSWTLKITDESGNVLRTYRGTGWPPDKLDWDGKDDQGRVVADGKVKAEFSAVYPGGVEAGQKAWNLEMDNTPPALGFDTGPRVVYGSKRGTVKVPTNTLIWASDQHGIAAWEMVIRDSQSRVVNTLHGTGEPPANLVWDGRDAKGSYIASGQVYSMQVSAKDRLGNIARTKPLDLVVLVREVRFSLAAGTLFETGSANLKSEDYGGMQAAAASIHKYWQSGTYIYVVGHTDNQPIHGGQYADNQALSEARAQTVADALKASLGPEGAWIKVVGKGDTEPVADNDTPEGRAKNRRVEIIVKTKVEE